MMANREMTFLELRQTMITQREYYKMTWRQIAHEYNVSPAMVWKIVVKRIEPKDTSIRLKLHLQELAAAPVCPVHHKVHVRPCKQQQEYKDLFSMPAKELLQRLNNRE